MRRKLKERVGRRGHFRATFKRFGKRSRGYYPPLRTALFIDVRDEFGEMVTDHIWFMVGALLDRLDLQFGDEVFFVARVRKYRKRNPDAIDDDDPPYVEDYRLSNPTQLRKLGAGVTATAVMPLFDQAPAAQAQKAGQQ